MSMPGRAAGSLDRYLEEISRYPLIDREEEARLARGIREGDQEALRKLVLSNLRFVVSIARRYQNQGVLLPDLINEGNLGLIRAAHRFDPTRGMKFISYAVWWIRQAILQALADQSRVVRIPLNRALALHRIGQRSTSLVQKLGREPTAHELARDLGISTREVLQGLRINRPSLALDAPPVHREDRPLLESLPDPLAMDPEGVTFGHALRDIVDTALGTLDEREAKVLRLYFGLDDQDPMTLEEIGNTLGVTRERVRQVKERGLERLRHASRSRFLDAF